MVKAMCSQYLCENPHDFHEPQVFSSTVPRIRYSPTVDRYERSHMFFSYYDYYPG